MFSNNKKELIFKINILKFILSFLITKLIIILSIITAITKKMLILAMVNNFKIVKTATIFWYLKVKI